jgi:hypothetical protein
MNMFMKAGSPGRRGFLVGFAAVALPLSVPLIVLIGVDREFGIKLLAFGIALVSAALGGSLTALMCRETGPRGALHGAGLGAAAWMTALLAWFLVTYGGIIYLVFILPFLLVGSIFVGAAAGFLLKSPFPTSAERAARRLARVRSRRLQNSKGTHGTT